MLQLGPAAWDTLLDGLDLEHQLRGFLLKLQFADAWMKPLPQGMPTEYLLSTGQVGHPRPCHTSRVNSCCQPQSCFCASAVSSAASPWGPWACTAGSSRLGQTS